MIGQSEVSLEALFDSFCEVADALDMPQAERAGILGVALVDWPDWCLADQTAERRTELRRRLAYALPLMQTSLENHKAKIQ